MHQPSTLTLRLAKGAVIAAAYAVLTWLAALAGLAYGPVQFRFSEALTILPAFTGAAIPGLTLGCLLGNLLSGYGVYDMVFGTAATLLAAVLTRALRNVRFRGLPFLAPLPPVLCNALVIGLEVTVLNAGGSPLAFQNFSWVLYGSNAASVGLGELVVCCVLGYPLLAAIEKSEKLKEILR